MRHRLLSLLLGLLAGCGGAQATRPHELVILVEAVVEDLDPRIAASGYAIKVSRLVAAPLVSLNTPDLQPRFELAESVERPDDRTYLVTLRPGARFSDGAPVTAADVVATLDDLRGERSISPYRHAFTRITSLVAEGPRRVRITLAAPHAPFLSDLDMGILPASRLRRAAGRRIPDPELVGAGPLVIRERTPARIVLAPNPHYFGPRPRLARYVVKTVEDDNSRLLSLVAGGGDATQNTVAPVLLPALTRSARLALASGPSIMTTYLGLNLRDRRLADPRVRRAIALAIDRRRLVAAKFQGRATLAAAILPPRHWAHPAGMAPLPHDPAEAERLLDAAGWRRPAPGRPRMHLVYKTSANRFRVAVARVIARQLAEVGIAVQVRSYEWGVFFADLKQGSFQLASLQMTELAEPDYLYFFFHARDPRVPGGGGGGNRWGYASPEVDRLLEAGRLAQDRTVRRDLYRAVQARLREDLPVIPLWHEENVALLRRNVRGYALLPNARFDPFLRVWKE